MIPATYQELAIWTGMQFPVLLACAVVVRWVLRWNGEQHTLEIERIEKLHTSSLALKDSMIAERDIRIGELKTDLKAMTERHFPSLKGKGNDEGSKQ